MAFIPYQQSNPYYVGASSKGGAGVSPSYPTKSTNSQTNQTSQAGSSEITTNQSYINSKTGNTEPSSAVSKGNVKPEPINVNLLGQNNPPLPPDTSNVPDLVNGLQARYDLLRQQLDQQYQTQIGGLSTQIESSRNYSNNITRASKST
jgi:hypothetical protein